MTPLEEQLINQQYYTLSPLVAAATVGGLGRTDLSALLNPQLALGTGVINPEIQEAAMRQFIEQERAAADAEFNRERLEILAGLGRNPAEIVGQYTPVTSSITANISATGSGFTPDQQALLNLAVQSVAQGSDPDAIVTNLRSTLGDDFTSDISEGVFEGIVANLPAVRTEASDYAKAKRDYDEAALIAQQQVQALGASRPTIDEAALRREYYADQGIPIMGMLPDPSAQYQIDIEQLLGSQSQGERLAKRAREQGYTSSMVGPMAAVPEYGSMMTEADTLEGKVARKQLERYVTGNQALSQLLGQRLSQQGVTPYQDAMSQLLAYGTLEANK